MPPPLNSHSSPRACSSSLIPALAAPAVAPQAQLCTGDGCNSPPGAEQQQQRQVQASQQADQQAGQLLQTQADTQAAAICPDQGSAAAITCYMTQTDNSTGATTIEPSQLGPGSVCLSYAGNCTEAIVPVGLPGCEAGADVGSPFYIFGAEPGCAAGIERAVAKGEAAAAEPRPCHCCLRNLRGSLDSAPLLTPLLAATSLTQRLSPAGRLTRRWPSARAT